MALCELHRTLSVKAVTVAVGRYHELCLKFQRWINAYTLTYTLT
jgi:hypothetical protein